MRKSNYDKFPATQIEGKIFQGWDEVRTVLEGMLNRSRVLAVDCYTGVYEEELLEELSLLPLVQIVRVCNLYKDEVEIKRMTERFMTDDVLFGYVTNLSLDDYFDAGKLADAQECISRSDMPVVPCYKTNTYLCNR